MILLFFIFLFCFKLIYLYIYNNKGDCMKLPEIFKNKLDEEINNNVRKRK